MYTTLKRIVSKHTTEEDILAWKGFLLGIIIAVSIIGPLVSLALVFVFNEYNDIDDEIVEHMSNFIRMMVN